MREKLLYTVSISERDYVGEVMLLKPIGDELHITQGKIDDDELVPTKASELTLTLLCTEAGDPLADLFTVDPTQYIVEVGVCRTTAEGNEVCKLLWSGYISTGGYSQPYAKPPYRVTIHANDGLAILQTMPYLAEDGSMFTGVKSISQHINEIMSHISLRPTRVWPAYQLYVGQTENTFDTIGLSAEAIYSAFNDETPTYYDVLVSILRNFGLQLFQSYGTWVARPLSALIAKRRPGWYSDVSEGFGLGNIDRTLPLYGSTDDGYGMSTSAVMTLNPPLKEVTVTTDDESYSVQPLSAKLPELWFSWENIHNWTVRKGLAGIITNRGWDASAIYSSAIAHTFEGVLRATPNTHITISFKLHNRMAEEYSSEVAIVLIPKEWNAQTWMSEHYPYLSGGYWWDDVNKAWTGRQTTMKFTAPASPKSLGMRQVNREYMEETAVSVSHTVEGIPYDGMRLALMIRRYPTCEIYDVTIEVTNEGLSVEENSAPFIVTPFGHGSLNIEQKYVSTTALPLTALSFQQSIVDMATGESIEGMLSPSESTSIASAVASGIQTMRGGVTRTLEGDIYMPTPIDMNTLWRDRDGRAFYTNYMKTLAKRGVYNVQLCELLPLAEVENDAVSVTLPGMFMGNMIGIGNSVFYTTLTASGLWVTDVSSGKSKLVHEKNAPYMYVRKGYRCVCAIDYIQEEDAAQIVCTAYDAGGALLSAAQLDAAIIQDLALSSVQGIVETIVYDRLCDVWYCAYWNGEYLRTSIFDSSGARLSWANVTALNARPDEISLFPINNGFVVVYTKDGSSFAALHNNALHEGASVGGATSLGEVMTIAEHYIVFRRLNNIFIKPRSGMEVVADGAEAVALLDSKEYEFVCSNQVLVVFRNIQSRRLKVLDMRTLHEVNINDELFSVASVWLNGEYLRAYGNDKFYKLRISDGDGHAYEDLYDSSGQQLRDVAGNVLRVIKE